MLPVPLQARRRTEEALINRALLDADFRARLLSDPRKAIEEATGIVFPSTVKVVVHEEPEDTFTLCIPAVITASAELPGSLQPDSSAGRPSLSSPCWWHDYDDWSNATAGVRG